MSEDINKVDMAVILEGRIKERVKELMEPMVEKLVVNIIGKELTRQWDENKQHMQMEIAIQLGKIIGSSYEDKHKPLWEYSPKELGLSKEMLNGHMMGKRDEENEL